MFESRRCRTVASFQRQMRTLTFRRKIDKCRANFRWRSRRKIELGFFYCRVPPLFPGFRSRRVQQFFGSSQKYVAHVRIGFRLHFAAQKFRNFRGFVIRNFAIQCSFVSRRFVGRVSENWYFRGESFEVRNMTLCVERFDFSHRLSVKLKSGKMNQTFKNTVDCHNNKCKIYIEFQTQLNYELGSRR